jgi:hypothetical protein
LNPSPPAGCGLTVLRTVNAARATKIWRWNALKSEWSKTSYSAGRWFTAEEPQFANLRELAGLIEATQKDPRAFTVRGALAPDIAATVAIDPQHRILRRKHLRNGVDPSLVEVPRRWLICDIDGWPLPKWADLVDDPDTVIDHAVHELLPPAFHDAECFWQLSSSAGFSAGYLKVHLFFWLSEPATNDHIKAVLKQHAPAIDRAPFSAAQPIYVAAPVIVGGFDPLPRRTGWRKGLDEAVIFPELKPEQPKGRPVGTGAAGRVGGIEDALSYLGDGDGLDGFHAPLRTAIMRYAIRCNRLGSRDDDSFKVQLRDAIYAAPRRADRNPADPYCTDPYLDASIAGAFALRIGEPDIQTMAPHHTAATDTAEQARAELKRLADEYLNRVLEWHQLDDQQKIDLPAEHSALVVDVGVGKTKITREDLVGFIQAAKDGKLPHRVLWLVPTHKLGNETLAAMQLLGLNVAVLRGREADNPDTGNVETGEPIQKMCLNLPAVEDSLAAGYDPEQTACGSPKPNKPACPYYAECAYQRQKADVARADIIIASHQSLFYRLPKQGRQALALVIVDESWWQNGARPNQITPVASLAGELIGFPVLRETKEVKGRHTYKVDEIATNDLLTLSQKAQRAVETVTDEGFLSRDAIVATGLTAEDCTLAITLEWRRKREGLIWPGQRPADRRKAMEMAACNAGIPRRAALWDAMRTLLESEDTHTGRIQLTTRTDKDAGTFRAIAFHGRANIRPQISALPMLCLDATMPVDVVRHYLPRINVLAKIRAAAPHMTVRQVIGGWGKTSIVPHDSAPEAENKRRRGLISG